METYILDTEISLLNKNMMSLINQVQSQNQKIEYLNQKIITLENQLKEKKTEPVAIDEKKHKSIKSNITKYIKVIDDCIKYLNNQF